MIAKSPLYLVADLLGPYLILPRDNGQELARTHSVRFIPLDNNRVPYSAFYSKYSGRLFNILGVLGVYLIIAVDYMAALAIVLY